MERPDCTPPGFRPTDTVALSTVQRLDLYQRARKHSIRVNLVGFLFLAVGGILTGLLLHGGVGGTLGRAVLLAGSLGMAGTGMSLMWMRRACWSVLAGVWGIALAAAVLNVLLS